MIKVFGKSKEKTTDAPMGSAEYGKFIRAAYMDTVNEAVILSDDLDVQAKKWKGDDRTKHNVPYEGKWNSLCEK